MRQLGPDARAGASPAGPRAPGPLGILQWVYLGRILVALAVFLSAAFYFAALPPGLLLTLAIAALASLVTSGASAFYTHVAARHPGVTFIYLQALFDLVLVTTVVHVTGGAESEFIPLYILVIAVAAVLLPLCLVGHIDDGIGIELLHTEGADAVRSPSGCGRRSSRPPSPPLTAPAPAASR